MWFGERSVVHIGLDHLQLGEGRLFLRQCKRIGKKVYKWEAPQISIEHNHKGYKKMGTSQSVTMILFWYHERS